MSQPPQCGYSSFSIVSTLTVWNSANIRVYSTYDFNPYADIYAPLDQYGNPIQGAFRGLQLIHLPRWWPNDYRTWTTWPSYLAITHELAHAFFNVVDEYVYQHPEIECRSYYECVSIMDQAYIPFPKTEFCVRINHDSDGDTPQTAWWWGWSCWETIAYFNPEMYEPFAVYGIAETVASNYMQVIVH